MSGTFPDRIGVTIEARMASTRLPGKVMLPAAGRSLLDHLVERIRRARHVDTVIIATTVSPPDEVIVAEGRRIGCRVHRGPVEDVAVRLLGAARAADVSVLVQVTGDCPLIDPAHIDRTIEVLFGQDLDYAANNLEPGLPIGFDVRAFRVAALERAVALSADPIDRVHGSYFIVRNPTLFRVGGWRDDSLLAGRDFRLTVDEPADYELVRLVIEALHPVCAEFSAGQIIDLLRQRPDWAALNAHIRQKQASEG